LLSGPPASSEPFGQEEQVYPGQNGTDLTAKVDGHLDYLSQLATRLGVHDPVESYLVPVLGKWSDLHDEATKWRAAAKIAADVTSRLTSPLGGLDAVWQGADANSFLDYMQNVGLAGHDLADSLTAMADALDKTAAGLRQVAGELVDLLADTAEHSSDAMTVPVAGEARARQYLDELDHPSRQLYESVQDVLNAFLKLCQGVHGGQMFGQLAVAHKMPAQNWAPSAPQPAVGTPRSAVPPPSVPSPSVPITSVPAPSVPASVPPAAVPLAATPAAAHLAAAHSGAAGSPVAHAGGGAAAAPVGGLAAQSGPPPTSGAVVEPSGDSPGQVPGSAQSAGANPSAPAGSGGGMPMGGMGGMRGGQGGDAEHKSKIRVAGDPREIFGKPDRTAPPTIGEE
jgi:uncharacterized protein YukE